MTGQFAAVSTAPMAAFADGYDCSVLRGFTSVDRYDCSVIGGCQCEIGWTHDGDSDGCMVVGDSLLQNADAGQEEL